MSIEHAAPAISVVTNNSNDTATAPKESEFGSKLVQALAEYSGRFRSEFKLPISENPNG